MEEDWPDYSPADPSPSPQREAIPAEFAGLRADQALARLFPEHSRSRLQAWLKSGRILIDGKSPDSKTKVWGGELLLLSPEPSESSLAEQAEDIPLNVVFEDDTLIVIDKPVGLVVHPGSGNWSGTLLNALLHHSPALRDIPRAGIVHRLDKDTSGLMVVAKTLEAQTDLVRQLQARTVRRVYLALAAGAMKHEGTVNEPIGRHPSQRIKMAIVPENRGGKPAITHIRILEAFTYTTFVECSLETGRTHQIRVHMAAIHHPLVGDQVYGKHNPKLPEFPRQALHATRLGLVHPLTGLKMQWEVPLPADMQQLLEQLAQHDAA